MRLDSSDPVYLPCRQRHADNAQHFNAKSIAWTFLFAPLGFPDTVHKVFLLLDGGSLSSQPKTGCPFLPLETHGLGFPLACLKLARGNPGKFHPWKCADPSWRMDRALCSSLGAYVSPSAIRFSLGLDDLDLHECLVTLPRSELYALAFQPLGHADGQNPSCAVGMDKTLRI